MGNAALAGGFDTPAEQSAQAFRVLMEAMARPGTIHEIGGGTPPAPLSMAAGTLLLTLCDSECTLWLAPGLDRRDVRDWITFHTGARFVARGAAMFAVGAWPDLAPLSDFAPGTPEYPDRSATLIVEMPRLLADGARLTGPGIAQAHHLALPEIAAFRENAARFPLGLDFYFTCGSRLAALPRTTTVEAA